MSQYIRPKVTVHKCVGINRTRVLFEGGPYMRKYGMYINDQANSRQGCLLQSFERMASPEQGFPPSFGGTHIL